ncbi:MAG: sigma-70 family RNA polymerase sigma factor [Armatimonadota bacterium]|nr:sigma-70 family RNA polymerase sigma factor [Armatimonadota bacterium]
MGDAEARQPGAPLSGQQVPDGELTRLARAGRGSAFDELVQRHHGSVYRLCWALLTDRSDAEDAAQETFVRAYQSLGRYDADRTFGPWLRGIAAKVCLQSLRRRGRRNEKQTPLEARPMEPAAPENPEPSALADRAVQALATLSDTYRLPLALFYLRDASVAEVAGALEISPGAARVRLHRGREKLREMLMAETNDGYP